MSGLAGTLGLRLPSRRRAKAKAKDKPLEYTLLLTATMCLLTFGVVMVFSASSSASLLDNGDSLFYLKKTLMFGAVGLVALKILSMQRLETSRRLTGPILLGAIGLLLVTKVMGTSVNGAQRWLAFGPIQIQASEIAKIALMLYGASLLAERPAMTRDLRRACDRFLLIAAAICGLVVARARPRDRDGHGLLGRRAVDRRRRQDPPSRDDRRGPLVLLIVIAVLIEPYRMARLTSFIDPAADASGAGFQGQQASIALGSGGFFGVGIGESVQKAFYLPEAHTDMIAAVIGEELGPDRDLAAGRPLHAVRLRRVQDRPEGARSLRSPARRRIDGDDSGSGIDQPLRGAGPGTPDRRHTPIRLLRKQQPDHHPRGRRTAAQHRQRRLGEDGRAPRVEGASPAAGRRRGPVQGRAGGSLEGSFACRA